MPDFHASCDFKKMGREDLNKTYSYVTYEPAKPASVPNPGFYQALRDGEPLPIGSWTREFRERTGNDSFAKGERLALNISETLTGHLGWVSNYYLESAKPFDNVLADRLMTEAIAKAMHSSWDIGTFLAEADKTYELVRKAKDRTFQRADDIRRGNSKKGRAWRTAKAFASVWMEHRYGWRVLMYDLMAAYESAQRLRENKVFLDRYTAHDSFSEQGTRVDDYPTTAFILPAGQVKSLAYVDKINSVSIEKTTHYRAGCGARSTSAFPFNINPILTAWELVPFSFIIDWFVDVGSVIGANSPVFGKTKAYSWLSVKSIETKVQTQTWQPAVPSTHVSSWPVSSNSGSAVDKEVITRYDRFPYDAQSFGLSFNPNLSLAKFLDLAALAATRKFKFMNSFTR